MFIRRPFVLAWHLLSVFPPFATRLNQIIFSRRADRFSRVFHAPLLLSALVRGGPRAGFITRTIAVLFTNIHYANISVIIRRNKILIE